MLAAPAWHLAWEVGTVAVLRYLHVNEQVDEGATRRTWPRRWTRTKGKQECYGWPVDPSVPPAAGGITMLPTHPDGGSGRLSLEF